MSHNKLPQKRKLVYYIATSIDGFIAQSDGRLGGFSMEAQYISDYLRDLQTYDTVLMGRNTYEAGYQYGIQPGEPSPTYAHMMQYVLSQTMEAYQHEQLQVIRDDPAEFVQSLKSQDGEPIYLCGGGQLAGYLLEHQLIDEYIAKVNPVVFGQGIPAFGGYSGAIPLTLIDTKIYADGHMINRFRIDYQ